MAADLSLIVYAAQREAHELTSQRAGDGFTQRSLAHARWAHEAQDRPFHVRLEAAHRKIVEDAVFYFFQIVVVGIEDLFGLEDVDLTAARFRPRQHRQPLNVVAGDRIVGCHRRHALQPVQLLQRFFLHFFRHSRAFNLLPQVFNILLAFVGFAQLFLDGFHLLAQVVLALRLLHAVLDFSLDLVAKLLHLHFFRQVLIDLVER